MRRSAGRAGLVALVALLPASAVAQPLPPDLPPLGRTRAQPVLPPDAPIGRTRADPVLPQPKPDEADSDTPPLPPQPGETGAAGNAADADAPAETGMGEETATAPEPAAEEAADGAAEPSDLAPIGDDPPAVRDDPPVPDARPAPEAAPDPGPPESEGAADPAARETGPAELDTAETEACEAELTRLGARFSRSDPIEEGDCSAARPLAVEAIGDVALTSTPTLRCPVVLATARWVREVVVPAAALHLDAEVTSVEVSAGYVCRTRRNGSPTSTLSEHAFANAVDVAAVGLADGRRIPVRPRDDASPDRAFQAAIRGGACALFNTVIGPTTNALHDDHLHLDLAERRGGSKLCE